MPYLGNPAQQRFSSPRAASVYSGDGSTVAFTLEEVVSTDEDILVSVDGVIQEPSVAYAVSSGTTLTFTAAPSIILEIIFLYITLHELLVQYQCLMVRM